MKVGLTTVIALPLGTSRQRFSRLRTFTSKRSRPNISEIRSALTLARPD